jgi:hypothetical protein
MPCHPTASTPRVRRNNRFDQRPLMFGNLIPGNIPRRTLRPINAGLRPHAWVCIQQPALNNPELSIATQLGNHRATIPAESALESRILPGVHELSDQVLALYPSDRVPRECDVGGMNGTARFLTGAAVTVQKLERGTGNLEGNLPAQARSCNRFHKFVSIAWDRGGGGHSKPTPTPVPPRLAYMACFTRLSS